MISNNLCNSCTNIGCEFQSGIVRTECVFYMPPNVEPDNCGNYVVMQPVKPQEPCEDAIGKQAVLEYIHRILNQGTGKKKSFEFIQKYVEKLPPVNPQPKTGHWKKKEDDTYWWYVCSECEQEPLKNRWNDDDVLSTFCPNCGAKMVEPQESEE